MFTPKHLPSTQEYKIWSLIHPTRHENYHRVFSDGNSSHYNITEKWCAVFNDEGVTTKSPAGTFTREGLRRRVRYLLSKQYCPFRETWYVS